MSNGNSYQKFDGASGTYQEIPNGSGTASSKKTKWLVAAALLVVAGIGYTAYSMESKNPSDNVHKTLASKGNVQVKANGKLKLFDSISKSLFCHFARMPMKGFSSWLSIKIDSLEILSSCSHHSLFAPDAALSMRVS